MSSIIDVINVNNPSYNHAFVLLSCIFNYYIFKLKFSISNDILPGQSFGSEKKYKKEATYKFPIDKTPVPDSYMYGYIYYLI